MQTKTLEDISEMILEAGRRDFLKRLVGAAAGSALPSIPGLMSAVGSTSKEALQTFKVVDSWCCRNVIGSNHVFEIEAPNLEAAIKKLIDMNFDRYINDDDMDYEEVSDILQFIGDTVKDVSSDISSVSTGEESLSFIIGSNNANYNQITNDVSESTLENLFEWDLEMMNVMNPNSEYADKKRQEYAEQASNEDDSDNDDINYSRMDYAGGSEDEGYAKHFECKEIGRDLIDILSI